MSDPDTGAGFSANEPLVVFLAFAQDRVDDARYLRNLPVEQARIRDALARAVAAGLCEVVERANATVSDIFDVFQDPAYANRIAIFHFGGHAGGAALLLEDEIGQATTAHAAGFAQFLGEQRGLELVFLNGCSSQGQVDGLLAAGVSAVIATSQAIRDDVATNFAGRLYSGLAGGATLRGAFAQAEGAVRTDAGDTVRSVLRDIENSSSSLDDSHWPWQLFVAPGARDLAENWSLPSAAGDPLYALPAVPPGDLPPAPFKHLHWFRRSDAEVFFGRGYDIRRLFEALTDVQGAPIVLLFGATGVGKSSLLNAGLRPRLEASYAVVYSRRNPRTGLAGTLAEALDVHAENDNDVQTAWLERESELGRPLIVMLDQVEEAWTQPSGADALSRFSAQLRRVFHASDTRPQGRLLLSFRKEWLADVLRLLDAERLPRSLHELAHLNRRGVIEAINGPVNSKRLQTHYHLKVDPGLAEVIADDVLADRASTVAPTLQILLTKLWDHAYAANPGAPHLTEDTYQQLRRQGLLLDDFVDEQFAALRIASPNAVDSGLALDLLHYHTTALGTTESRDRARLLERYGHRPEVDGLIDQCKEGYLLIEHEIALEGAGPGSFDKATRLAHDTLAPLIRQRHEASDLAGQQALRIVEQRAKAWEGEAEGTCLDSPDLAVVEAGERGMRAWTEPERRLVTASRAARAAQHRRSRILTGVAMAGLLVIAGVAGLATWLWRQALLAEGEAVAAEVRSRDRAIARSRDRATVSQAQRSDPTTKLLLLLEVQNPDDTPAAIDQLTRVQSDVVAKAVLEGHTHHVFSAAFNASDDVVLTLSGDETARLWDADSGAEIAVLEGHTDGINSATFSTAGERLVTTSGDNTARLWDAATGAAIAVIQGHTDSTTYAAFDDYDELVVTASLDGTARLWEAATGAGIAVLDGHTDGLNSAAFNYIGDRVVTASRDGTARLWNVDTGAEIATLEGHTSGVVFAAFNEDDDRIVTVSYEDKAPKLWDAATGTEITGLGSHRQNIMSAAFSSSGDSLVTASLDNTARLWDAGTGSEIAVLEGHTDGLVSAAYNTAGDRVVTSSLDNTARIWEAATGAEIAVLEGHTYYVWSAAYNHVGDRVVTASGDKTARLWDVPSHGGIAMLEGHANGVTAAAFNTGGDKLVTASWDFTARLWDAATGGEIDVLKGHTAGVTDAAFNTAGDRVVTASRDNTARLWDTATGAVVAVLEGHTDEVLSAAFNAAGDRVVTASGDSTERLWDTATGSEIATFEEHEKEVFSAAFNATGDLVITASNDSTARLWDTTTHRRIAVFEGHTSGVFSAAFNPAGDQVVTASRDTTARLWDVATGTNIAVLEGHEANVRSAAFDNAGARIVTASSDGARLWDAATGAEIALLEGHTDSVVSAAFNFAGDRIVTASRDKTALLWGASGELLQAIERSRTVLCVDKATRIRLLGESNEQALLRFDACNTCVGTYFDTLNVDTADAKPYLAAWGDYKSCLCDQGQVERCERG